MIEENDYIRLELKNGILYSTYKTDTISLEAAKSVVSLRKKYTLSKNYPNLISGMNLSKISKDARDFLSSPAGTDGVSAGALLSKSSFQAAFANFFLMVAKPKIPTKLFTDEKEALQWLDQYK